MEFEALPKGGIRRLDDLLSDIINRMDQFEDAEAMQSYVNEWLTAHPEATTTVQDGSITASKLAVSMVTTVTNGNMTFSFE